MELLHLPNRGIWQHAGLGLGLLNRFGECKELDHSDARNADGFQPADL